MAVPVDEIVEKNGLICIKTVGTSMYPFIISGRDTVLIAKKTKKLKKYDVALYKRDDGSYILHRVLKVLPDTYNMCGDNHIEKEIGVREEQVIGVLEGYYKNLNYVDINKFWYKFKVRVWCFLPIKVLCLFFINLVKRDKNNTEKV